MIKELGTNTPFKFIEIADPSALDNKHLIKSIKTKKIDGFIAKSLLNENEVNEILKHLSSLSDSVYMRTPAGKIFPHPFAVVSDEEERLEAYYNNIKLLEKERAENQFIDNVFNKLHEFISLCSGDYQVSVPLNKVKNSPVVPGTFRYLFPDLGGLYVHCGNYFQDQSKLYYSLVKNDIEMDNQLSYFIVLQNADYGGELTLYDLYWEAGQSKDDPQNNDYIIGTHGNKIFMKYLESLDFRPDAGDILIFNGGPIWHRVEDVKGNQPRITLGGFLNFSKDGKELFYWS
ncbi:MAG: hypothetical protein WD607_05700 [Candidatus Paceibacterota bacterium]